MLARHKAVDAFVAQKIEANVDMQLQMDPITQRLLEGRERLLSADARRRRGEIERSVPAIMSESWRSNPMCGVEDASVAGFPEAVLETCLTVEHRRAA